jgi:hypothetical protein
MESLQALEQPVPDLDAILRRLEAAQYEAAFLSGAREALELEKGNWHCCQTGEGAAQ